MTRDELEQRAAQLGIKPQTLRMRLYREDQKKRQQAYKEPELETFGLRLSHATAQEVRDVRLRLRAVANHASSARVIVERLRRSKLPAPTAQLDTIEGALLSLEERIAGAMPRSLCPYCKGLDRIQDDCRPCNGTGLASVQQFDRAPRKLKSEPLVMSEGREVPIADFHVGPKRDPFGA